MKYERPEMEIVEMDGTVITQLSVGDENSGVTEIPGLEM